jgi:nitroreductase
MGDSTETVSDKTLIDRLEWRYATKRFDPAKKIPAHTWNTIQEAMRLAPSSYGIQPWKFIVVSDPAVREKIKAAAWNQPQITEASELVVFAIKKHLSAGDIDAYLKQASRVQNVPLDALTGYRGMMIGDLIQGPRSITVNFWSYRQVYIALGFALSAAAMLGIDACPMEGFDPAKVDDVLSLCEKGLASAVIATFGYRSPEDKLSAAPKVRFPAEEVFIRV